MSGWQVVLADSAALVLLALLVLVVALVARRRFLARGGGLFELSVHDGTDAEGRGWTLGLGRYSGEYLEWFRVFSLSLRPKRAFRRGRLQVERRRSPVGAEAFAIYSGHVIVECSSPDGPVQLAMSTGSLTGFLSWSESSPPGRDSNVVL